MQIAICQLNLHKSSNELSTGNADDEVSIISGRDKRCCAVTARRVSVDEGPFGWVQALIHAAGSSHHIGSKYPIP